MPPDTTCLKRSSSPADDNDQRCKKSRTSELVPDEDPTGISHANNALVGSGAFTTPASVSVSRVKHALDPGSSTFADLVGLGAFVDKSLALRDFLDVGTPIHLLLRPRRSGKTTLLRMFRDFLALTSPDELARRKDLFKGLAISQDERFKTDFGKYPVIYLDFSKVTGSSSMPNLLQNFKNHVANVVQHLDMFRNRDKLPKDQHEFLDEVVKGKIHDSKWRAVLMQLTNMLHVWHKEKVFVLIDEYDAPLTYAANYPYFPEANELFHGVFSDLLKDNEDLRGAMLVGILRVAKAGLLSGLNNVSVFPLGGTSQYSTACMFTEHETRSLYERQAKVMKIPFTFNDLENWYNGYLTCDGAKLFNPWSVSNALTKGELSRWWIESGYDATFQARITALLDSDGDFRTECQVLLDGEEMNIKLDCIGYSSLPTLSKEQLWTFMYYTGYLTKSSNSLDSERIFVRIPNFEIISEFRKWIWTDFNLRMAQAGYDPSVSLFFDMVGGNFAEFSKALGEFVLETVPQCIFGNHEKVYQEYVYAYFSGTVDAMVKLGWTMKIESVAGDGRADIFLFDEKRGVIVEFKHIQHPKKEGYRDHEASLLSKGTKDALDQCDTRHYRSSMPQDVMTICEYGIAFLGPYCGVEARMLEKKDGKWITRTNYSASADEKRRKETYIIRQDEIL